jgi:hypothetical protein
MGTAQIDWLAWQGDVMGTPMRRTVTIHGHELS